MRTLFAPSSSIVPLKLRAQASVALPGKKYNPSEILHLVFAIALPDASLCHHLVRGV